MEEKERLELMGNNIGLWIDHNKAVVVGVTDKEEEKRVIVSQAKSSLAVLAIRLSAAPMSRSRSRRMIAARNDLRVILTSITMRLL